MGSVGQAYLRIFFLVNDQFGYSTEVLDEFIAIGSLKADGNGVDSGAVHIFKQNEQAWEEIDTSAFPSGNDQLFGTDLIKRGKYLFISSPGAGTHGKILSYEKTLKAMIGH